MERYRCDRLQHGARPRARQCGRRPVRDRDPPDSGANAYRHPSFLPGGTRVLFERADRSRQTVMVGDLASGHSTALFPGAAAPTWVPPGYVVYGRFNAEGSCAVRPARPSRRLSSRGRRHDAHGTRAHVQSRVCVRGVGACAPLPPQPRRSQEAHRGQDGRRGRHRARRQYLHAPLRPRSSLGRAQQRERDVAVPPRAGSGDPSRCTGSRLRRALRLPGVGAFPFRSGVRVVSPDRRAGRGRLHSPQRPCIRRNAADRRIGRPTDATSSSPTFHWPGPRAARIRRRRGRTTRPSPRSIWRRTHDPVERARECQRRGALSQHALARLHVRRDREAGGVRPTLPRRGPTVRVSRLGGRTPRWRSDGRELFFEAPDGGILVASPTPGPGFQASVPKLLFHVPGWTRPLFFDIGTPYDVSPDGQRFIVRQTASTKDAVLVLNWAAKLEAKGGS